MKTQSTITSRSRLLTAMICGAFALGFGALSIAADNSDVPEMVVNFADLNLSDPQGAATLYDRIDIAAHEVCDESYEYDEVSEFDLMKETMVITCVHRAIADAVTRVGALKLYAVYNAKNHRYR